MTYTKKTKTYSFSKITKEQSRIELHGPQYNKLEL